MKKLWLVLILLLAAGLALDITIQTTPIDLGQVELDSGFYGATPGNINLSISKTAGTSAELLAEIDSPLTSPEGYQLPADALQWQIYYWTGKEVDDNPSLIGTSAGFTNWMPYRRSPASLLRINDNISSLDLQLGTTVRRVPSVQPEGVYTTRIRFTVIED